MIACSALNKVSTPLYPETIIAHDSRTLLGGSHVREGTGECAARLGNLFWIGAGSIGLLAAAVLKDRGVNVDVVARHPHHFAAADIQCLFDVPDTDRPATYRALIIAAGY